MEKNNAPIAYCAEVCHCDGLYKTLTGQQRVTEQSWAWEAPPRRPCPACKGADWLSGGQTGQREGVALRVQQPQTGRRDGGEQRSLQTRAKHSPQDSTYGDKLQHTVGKRSIGSDPRRLT